MAHYEMYICLKKVTYESQVPSVLQPKLGWDDSNGDAYTPTWKESAFRGKLGAPRVSPGGSYIILKGEFSMKEGELTAMAGLGASMAYPNNTVLTKSEALALVNSETWNNA